KFIPYPVTTGFTSGIAVIIFSSQIKDFTGLKMGSVPAEFVDKWRAYFDAAVESWQRGDWAATTLAVGAGSLAIMLVLRRFAPRIPGPIVAVVAMSCLTALFKLPVETVASRFGEIPHSLP